MTAHATARYGVNETDARGRRHHESAPAYRGEFQRDRDRIVHSSAFRRLEYKTQVFVNHEGDMFRTRLTHSIEVAQIGRAIARVLGLHEDLTEAIALAHDLGHTPFGHAGQDALNTCMREHGGFEHNLQSLRVVETLEERYAEFSGLNLMFETREGILKHCSPRQAEALGELGQRFIHRGQPSLEAQVVNMADGIAYNNHDVDDGLRAGLLRLEQLGEVALFAQQHDEVCRHYPDLATQRLIHEVIRRMINRQVVDLIETSQARIKTAGPEDVEAVRRCPDSLIGFSDEMAALNLALKQFLRTGLYRHYRVHRMTVKAGRIIGGLFEAFTGDLRLLPPAYQHRAAAAGDAGSDSGCARVVADYIAGMTDRFAIVEYERIYNPTELT